MAFNVTSECPAGLGGQFLKIWGFNFLNAQIMLSNFLFYIALVLSSNYISLWFENSNFCQYLNLDFFTEEQLSTHQNEKFLTRQWSTY